MSDSNGITAPEDAATTSSTDGISVAVAAGRALLGAALLSPDAASVVIEVDPVSWPTSDLRAIALAVVQTYSSGRPVDPIVLAEQLHRSGANVALEDLTEMMLVDVPAVSLAAYYAEILARYQRDRQLVELADQLGRAALEGQDVAPIVARIVEVAR
jgi:replicative DNA helicase